MFNIIDVFESLQRNNESIEIHTLRDLIIYGLRGISIYALKAYSLGKRDEICEKIFLNIYLAAKEETIEEEDLFKFVMELGNISLRYVELIGSENEAKNYVAKNTSKIINYIMEEKIKYLFIVGGEVDKDSDEYYKELGEGIPKDAVILTFGDIKHKFNNFQFGSIGDIPRLIDVGECEDIYVIIKLLLALWDTFNCNINELPIRVFSFWDKPKSLSALFILLSLGIENIYVKPLLPANKFNLKTMVGVNYISYP